MYRVAICEDEDCLREELRQLCGEILGGMGVDYEVETCASARELREALALEGGFDLLCLDILMPGENGMELARELRESGDETSILFTTSSTDFLLEGYGVRPIQYLLKPIRREALEKVLADDIRLHYAPRTVSVTVGGKTAVLSLNDIRYVESRNHGCAFVMEGREQFFWLSMTQAETLLPTGQFRRCHNSYLVNMAAVVRVDARGVELSGGVVLPVSRRYAADFQSALTRYLNNEPVGKGRCAAFPDNGTCGKRAGIFQIPARFPAVLPRDQSEDWSLAKQVVNFATYMPPRNSSYGFLTETAGRL